MTMTPSRREARRRLLGRRRIRRSALASGAAVLGVLLPMAGLAAAHAADPIDDIPPLLDRFIFSPNENGWHKSNPNMRLVATERGGSFVKSISYILDGGPVQTTTAPESATRFEVAVDLSAHGIHELEVWTHDTAGNESIHQTGTFKVDTAAPTISVPADGVFPLGEVVPLHYECADDLSGIDLCTGTVDNGGLLITTDPGTFTVPLTALDLAGNSRTSVYTYTVVGTDVDGPSIEFHIAPEPASGWYQSYLGIGFAASDPSGVSSVHWNTDGAVSTNGDVFGESWGAFDLTFDGITEVWGWAYDTLGNRSETPRRTVRIDTVLPTITLNSPALPATDELEVEQGSAVPLDFECADEHSGIDSCHAHGVLPFAPGNTGLDHLPTDELGPQTVTLRALDVAGNEEVREIAYTVVPAESGTDADADGGDADADGGNAGADGGDADAGADGGNADGGDADADGGNAGADGGNADAGASGAANGGSGGAGSGGNGTGANGSAGSGGAGGAGASGSASGSGGTVTKPVARPTASGGLAVTGADSTVSIAIAAVLLLSGVSALALRASRGGIRRGIRTEGGE